MLKLTVPGVPDIYQGAELWEQSMVDPDNRREVDFARRMTMLEELPRRSMDELRSNFRDGGIKLAVMSRLLRYRASHPTLFRDGTYRPLQVDGDDANSLLAFERVAGDERMVVVAGLGPWLGPLSARLEHQGLGGTWRDLLRDCAVESAREVPSLLADGLPAAVLEPLA